MVTTIVLLQMVFVLLYIEEGSFGTIEGATKHIIKRKTLLSNAQSVQELLEEIKEAKAMITKVLGV